jgi:hypothetical protein
MNRPDSTAKNMPKIAEMKLSSCGLEVADIINNCDCGIAELRLRSNISFKSCRIVIAGVLPSSCGIAIADSKKVARAHLCRTVQKLILIISFNKEQKRYYIIYQ